MPLPLETDHPGWKGDDVGYMGLHGWMRRKYPRVGRCEYCGRKDGHTERASAGHTYTRNWADWFELCKDCHRNFDGRTPTAETRAKISAKLKGRPLSVETRAKMSLARKGVSHTPEHTAKIAAANRRRKRSVR